MARHFDGGSSPCPGCGELKRAAEMACTPCWKALTKVQRETVIADHAQRKFRTWPAPMRVVTAPMAPAPVEAAHDPEGHRALLGTLGVLLLLAAGVLTALVVGLHAAVRWLL